MPAEQKCFDNIAALVRTKRADHPKELSQTDLSTLLGYKNGQFISNVERGLCSVPLKKLPELCSALSIPRDEVINALVSDLKAECLKYL